MTAAPNSAGPVAQPPPLLMLTLVAAMAPFAMTLCVPALPLIAADLDTDAGSAQLLVSLYLLALGLAQPFLGALADQHGRRRVLISALTVFILASIGCAMADQFTSLVVLRALQGAGIAASGVIARAVIRDLAGREHTGRYTAYLSAGVGLAPTVAPLAGGLITTAVGWRWTFSATAMLGVVLLAWISWQLRESASFVRNRRSQYMHKVRTVIQHHRFWGYTLIYGCINSTFFIIVASGADFYAQRYQLEPVQFGLVLGVLAAGYTAGAITGGTLSPRLGLTRCLELGLMLSALGAAGMLVWAIADLTLAAMMIALSILYFAAGLASPQAMAGAILDHPEMAGTATGLSSSLGMIFGGLVIFVSAALYTGSSWSFGLPIVVVIAVAVISYPLMLGGRRYLR